MLRVAFPLYSRTSDRATLPPAPTAPRDVVFAFAFTSWRGALERGLCMPEDRLADALRTHPRVRGLLVANPYRSVVAKVARLPREGRGGGWPAGRGALHEPLRLRRRDPDGVAALERAYARYERGLRRAATRLGLERPAIITTHPLVAGFGRFDWAGPVTYYAWDDWAASVPHQALWPAFDAAFARLRATGRRVCAISAAALARIAPTGASAVVPNGIEAREWLEPGPPPPWFAARPRPRLLYIGSLDGRVEVEQVRRVASAFPEGSVTLVGPQLQPDHFAPLRGLPNVELRPRVDREQLTGLVAAADACLIPHVRNPLTEAMSPLKLYEYLAGGRPVAAVALPPIVGVDPRVALVEPGADLVPAVRRALALGPAPEAERRAFVHAHAWERRHERILRLALDGVGDPA
jgi:hypothetical protein